MRIRIKILLLVGVTLMSLLTSCGKEPGENTTLVSSEPTEGTGTTEPPYVTLPPEESRPVLPTEDPVGPTVNTADKPNTEKGVYASCGNYYYTMYLDQNKDSIRFYILTETPLPQDSKIQSDLQTVMQVDFEKVEPGNMSWDFITLADWLGADVDWSVYWQLLKTYYDTLFDWDAGKCDDNTLLAAYNAERAYFKNLDDFLPKAWQLQKDWYAGNPFFHIYEVTIYLRGYTLDEDLTELTLVAGDMSRTIRVGLIRLREKMDPSTIETNKLVMKGPVTSVTFQSEANTLSEPRSSGVLEMKWDFVAQRDMMLTDAYFYANGGEGCTIVGAEVQLTPTDGNRKKLGQSRVVTWVPGTPLEVKKNEQVECRVYYEDPRTQMMDYGAKHYMVMEYVCEGVSGKVLSSSENCLRKWSNWINQYFWAFTDYNFMTIAEQYYQPNSQYAKEHNYKFPNPPKFTTA